METNRNQEITILGPNLPRELDMKGSMHAHATGCGHIKRYPADVRGGYAWEFTAASRRQIIEEVYADFIFANDESPWEDYEGEVYMAPCVKLPREV